MTADNLRHWDVLSKTDPRHTKPFKRAGGFRGTAIKPIWTAMRLTEHFGPYGVGWGCNEPVFRVIEVGDEILVYCVLACWYAEDGKVATIYGVGGDKVRAGRRDGPPVSDDEAFKKAFTDAIGNCFKNLGAGADVHMGLFEDDKYVTATRREFSEQIDEETGEITDDAGGPAVNVDTRAKFIEQSIGRAKEWTDSKIGLGDWYRNVFLVQARDFDCDQVQKNEVKQQVIIRATEIDRAAAETLEALRSQEAPE